MTERELTPSRRDWRPMLVIGVVSSAIGIALGLAIDWFPTQASEEAERIDTLWDVLVIVSVPVFVLVEVVVLYSVWRFRMKPGEELRDGPPIHGNTRLEVIWTAIPAIILVLLCSYSYVVLTDIEEAAAEPALPVTVVGEQFTWTFHYEGPGGKRIVSPQLYVPRGRQVYFTVRSKDVLHDFWVPAFRLKIDAVRGIDTHVRVTPKRLGEYPVVCAELCGLGHAVMRQTAHVIEPPEFERWLRERAAPAEGKPAAEAQQAGGGADGKTLFNSVEPKCSSCHTLADANAGGAIGPNLDETLKGKDEAYIRRAIEDPEADIAPGGQPGVMPTSYGETLEPAELDALVKYLAEVTSG